MFNIYSDPVRYDILCRNWGGEEFFLDAVKRLGGPYLELGSGTGRVVGKIAETGVRCLGIDLQEQMVDFASKRYPQVDFAQGDMTELNLGETFRVIGLPNNTFQYLWKSGERAKVLESVKNHLADGGEFLLSIINPNPEVISKDREKPVEFEPYQDPETGQPVVVSQVFFYDPKTRIGRTIWSHSRGDEADFIVHEFALYYSPPDEIDTEIERAGLNIIAKYGTHSGEPFTKDSNLQVFRIGIE